MINNSISSQFNNDNLNTFDANSIKPSPAQQSSSYFTAGKVAILFASILGGAAAGIAIATLAHLAILPLASVAGSIMFIIALGLLSNPDPDPLPEPDAITTTVDLIQQDINALVAPTPRAVQFSEATLQAFDKLLTDIQESVKRPDTVLDEDHIERNYKVRQLLNQLPEEEQRIRKEQLQKVLNNACVLRELKEKGKLVTGSSSEIKVLRFLGYPIDDESTYNDKEKIYGILRDAIQQQLLVEGFSGSLKNVRMTLMQKALHARLSTLNIVSDHQVQKFKEAVKFYKSVYKEIDEQFEKETVETIISDDFPLKKGSPLFILLEREFNFEKKNAILEMIKLSFEQTIAPVFKDQTITPEEFSKCLPAEKDFLIKTASEDIQSQIATFGQRKLATKLAFHQKWGTFLKHQFVQGFNNSNEIFKEGVCWALCNRLRMVGQKNSVITSDELATHIHIKSTDRFLQVVAQAEHSFQLREDILSREGFDEDRSLFSVDVGNDFIELVNVISQKLKQEDLSISSGWLQMALIMNGDGHAVSLRLDNVNNRLWFFDPNIGFFCFEEQNRSYDDSFKAYMEFLHDLLEMEYSSLKSMYVQQLIPKIN